MKLGVNYRWYHISSYSTCWA